MLELSNVRIHKISLCVVTFSVSAQYIHADIKKIIFLIFGGPQKLHTTKIVNEMLQSNPVSSKQKCPLHII